MPKFETILKKFDYYYPSELIAQKPSHPRDSARLLVYNRKIQKSFFDTFSNIGKYLPKNSVLVFNQTKVLPARIIVKKDTGGKAEILYISSDTNFIKVIADRKLSLKSKLAITNDIFFEVTDRVDNFYILKPNFKITQIKQILNKYGLTPLPPYIKNSPLSEKQKRNEYQTVFAKTGLSVAAPTASLHFSKKLIANLKKQGIEVKFITLNVNLGTFAPLKEENLKSGLLHSEDYEISSKTARELNQAKKAGKIIIAVGTTVCRTLESASENNQIIKFNGNTRLFIQKGYKFQFINSLITNFHVPKSSLLILVSALIGRAKLLNLYKIVIRKKYRLFSFGDGMLIH